MKLYGKHWTRKQLEARVGRIEQIGGIRWMKLLEGKEEDVKQIHIRTGSGLSFYVCPTKGMDISLADYCGVPLTWQSPNGDCHPAYYDPYGKGWLRSASGGLLMTCGLSQVGTPTNNGDTYLGLHGRIHHTPAKNISSKGHWTDDNYEMIISGEVEEGGMFESTLKLTREIRSKLGENKIIIKDEVENIGFEDAPHMILYHFNFGFPLMNDQTIVKFPSRTIKSRDKNVSLNDLDKWQDPTKDVEEMVYYHSELKTISNRHNWSEVSIYNPAFPKGFDQTVPITVKVKWCTENLNNLVQWKMPGERMHVLGIEPSNCLVEGQLIEKQRGTLKYLAPGESKIYQLEIEISEEDK